MVSGVQSERRAESGSERQVILATAVTRKGDIRRRSASTVSCLTC